MLGGAGTGALEETAPRPTKAGTCPAPMDQLPSALLGASTEEPLHTPIVQTSTRHITRHPQSSSSPPCAGSAESASTPPLSPAPRPTAEAVAVGTSRQTPWNSPTLLAL